MLSTVRVQPIFSVVSYLTNCSIYTYLSQRLTLSKTESATNQMTNKPIHHGNARIPFILQSAKNAIISSQFYCIYYMCVKEPASFRKYLSWSFANSIVARVAYFCRPTVGSMNEFCIHMIHEINAPKAGITTTPTRREVRRKGNITYARTRRPTTYDFFWC